MNIKKYIAVITLIFIGLISVNAQSKTTFGLQYKPILPIKVLNVTELKLSEKGMNVTLSPKLGLNFGAIIRWELLEKLSLETGLNYNKRSFKMEAILEDTAVSGSLDFSIITYEVPIQALFYVRLSKQWYMNVASGFSINFRASNVGKLSEDKNFSQITYVKNINLAYVANIGIEYRTKESGAFYLGASLTNPFRPLGEIHATSQVENYSKEVVGDVSGNYISVDLRYFFHEKKEKTKKKK
ncbi:MAG: outer membrane beta-barrel protein [Flavobacteriales bacterium]